jgi:DNA-binding IclR family transcriptional regulator
LHATSNGKVLLAWLSLAEQKAQLGTMPAYTPQTVTKRQKLLAQLAQVAEHGYAIATDELEVGLTAVAAPLRNAHGDVVASLSVSGPTFRLGEARIDEVLAQVIATATEISHRLGWSHR